MAMLMICIPEESQPVYRSGLHALADPLALPVENWLSPGEKELVRGIDFSPPPGVFLTFHAWQGKELRPTSQWPGDPRKCVKRILLARVDLGVPDPDADRRRPLMPSRLRCRPQLDPRVDVFLFQQSEEGVYLRDVVIL
ncbi:hypothetical protein FAF44_41205 [Nonomuraea sp. MG754425]|uniref:hypothetical protein n=1 Tax=Nonomuraea sp. MG754425 TaxID=2570319 RepID=UPI001F3EC715|nr:hypothetical protein [Nonomuraea sp. MG754425]MCF6474752.1 hypothetical protein [Nonomuraea sp. MG754425]